MLAAFGVDISRFGSRQAARFVQRLFEMEPTRAQEVQPEEELCVQTLFTRNAIVRIPEQEGVGGMDRAKIAMHVCDLCVTEARRHSESEAFRKSCILAPTAPLLRQHFATAVLFHWLHPKLIIGDSSVDAWDAGHWRDMMTKHHLILIAPKLFLDVLDQGFLRLEDFCTLVFDECQHCLGTHPFARILNEHYANMADPGTVRMLGFGRHLVKRTIRTIAERQVALRRLSDVMNAQIYEASELRVARPLRPGLRAAPWHFCSIAVHHH